VSTPKPQSKTEGRVRLLGWLQLAASGIIFFLLLKSAIQGQLNILTILLCAFAISLNFFAGYLSIKRKALGYWLSIVNQSLQILSFAVGSILYRYSGIGGVYLTFLKDDEGVEFGFLHFIRKVIVKKLQEGDLKKEEIVGRLLNLSLIIYALSESIAIYGLILFLLAGNSLNFYIFLMLCLVCLGIYFPRYGQWESWAKREWNLKNKGGG
jgi:hypothetical protein